MIGCTGLKSLLKVAILVHLSAHLCTASFHYNLNSTTQNHETSSKRFTRSIAVRNDHVRQSCIGCSKSEIGTGVCTTKNFLRVKRYAEVLKCQPESTLVNLQTPGPDYSMEPPLAKVKRCSGYCRYLFHKCIATETSFVKVPVILIHHLTGTTKCVEYEVEQHDSCSCDCEIQAIHCSQRHKHEHCSCKCANENDRYECLEGQSVYKREWDEEKCECICEEEFCPFGFKWNGQKCKCEMESSNDTDNLLF